ncbi:hypothetical protein Pth03_77880 [Planotetraspora thailandica]|uniref:Uncharacterized protein n=1 Tax=Planotetraspora thailandica TaxID=487172 RepID=A0A8J4DEQ9_9ACTN|nr:hypothetical protein [Planotetraspora thailandica]GII59399.1 hypothetical protein Pth03_77880 [Planotetraspora thailandica]
MAKDKFKRLDELTAIKNDFDRELLDALNKGRRGKLSEDHKRVDDARHSEIVKLMKEGHSPEELSRRLDDTDRYRR